MAGLLTLPYETLAVPAEPEHTIVVYTPEPGSETAERLALLGSWASVGWRRTPEDPRKNPGKGYSRGPPHPR